MTAPLLKTKDGSFVRASDEVAVKLRGGHLNYFTFKFHQSASSAREIERVDTALSAPASGGWGWNLITFWVDTDPVLGITSGDYDATRIARWNDHLDALVAKCEAHNAYLMLSWHNNGGWDGHTKLIDADGKEAMRILAARFSGNPTVFFSVQAEPPGGIGITFTALRNACIDTIDKIRGEYPGVIVGLPGLIWSKDCNGWISNPLSPATHPNVFIKQHVYANVDVNGDPQPNDGGGTTLWDNGAGLPVLIGEFGTGGTMNNTHSQNLIDICEARGWAWQGWAYSPIGGPEMFVDDGSESWDSVVRTSWGDLIFDNTVLLFEPPSGVLNALQMVTQPTGTVLGQNIGGPPAVKALDTEALPLEGVVVTVTLNKGSFQSGTLQRTTNALGIATFSDLVIAGADTGYRLTFDANPTIESTFFSVTEDEEPAGEPASSLVSPLLEAPTLYQIVITDRNHRLLGVVDQFLSASYVRSWQDGSSFQLHIPDRIWSDEEGDFVQNPIVRTIQEDRNVRFRFRFEEDEPWREDFIGFIEHAGILLGAEDIAVWEIRGRSLLERRIILPPALASHEKYTNTAAETILKNYMTNAIINPVNVRRKIGAVALETDLARGALISASARFTNLLGKLTETAQAGNIGFELAPIQIENVEALGGAIVQFVVIPGVDHSQAQSVNPHVIFSTGFGNIESQEFEWSVLGRHSIAYVGGQGEGELRTVVTSHGGGLVPGAPGFDVFSGLQLDGEFNFVLLPREQTVRGQAQVTLEGYVWIDDQRRNVMFMETMGGADFARLRFEIDDQNKLHATIRPFRDGSLQSHTTVATVPMGEWVHVALHIDLSAGTMKFRIWPLATEVEVVENFGITAQTEGFNPFSDPKQVGFGKEFDTGELAQIRLDHWRLWHTNRSDVEIADNRKEHITDPTNVPGLAGYYTLDDAAGTVARDHAANALDGEIQGDATWVEGAITVEVEGTPTATDDLGPQDLARRELFVDARDLELESSLVERGRSKLREEGPKARMSSDILPVGPFRYRSEWDLGDIVTIRNREWGIAAHLRVMRVELALEPEATPGLSVAFGSPSTEFTELVQRAFGRVGPVLQI